MKVFQAFNMKVVLVSNIHEDALFCFLWLVFFKHILNKNFDLLDTRLSLSIIVLLFYNYFMIFCDHTDVLNALCSCSAQHKKILSIFLILIKGKLCRDITTYTMEALRSWQSFYTWYDLEHVGAWLYSLALRFIELPRSIEFL